MELTPQHLRDVELAEVRRGYDPDAVDDLLEQAAAAMDALREQARLATERASRAEQALEEAADSEESVRRSLALAERAADLAVEEARATASNLVAEAEERGRAIEHAARERARLGTAAHPDLGSDIEVLQEVRAAFEADIVALDAHLAQAREEVRATLSHHLAEIDGMRSPLRPPELASLAARVDSAPVDPGGPPTEAHPLDPDGEGGFLVELRHALDVEAGRREAQSAGEDAAGAVAPSPHGDLGLAGPG